MFLFAPKDSTEAQPDNGILLLENGEWRRITGPDTKYLKEVSQLQLPSDFLREIRFSPSRFQEDFFHMKQLIQTQLRASPVDGACRSLVISRIGIGDVDVLCFHGSW